MREVEALMAELESRTDRLRALFEQYFLGFERLEPSVPRKDVERRFQQLLKVPFRNTALRFRFTMLQQRYNTYQTYWMRTCRKIEDGTYKRQIQRTKAKEADYLRNVETAAAEEAPIEIVELDGLDGLDFEESLESAAPTLPPRKMSDAPAAAAAAEPGKAWNKPASGNTFDTRPTTPRMKAVRIPVAKKEDDKTPTPAAAAAANTAATPAIPPAKPKGPPPLPIQDKVAPAPNEMHSRATTPRMQAVRLPEKNK